MWKVTVISIFLLLPMIAFAAGLVPCGGVDEPMCQSCHVLELINIVVNWLIAILTTVTALLIAYAGLRLVVSVGDVSAMTQAKTLISNCLIGFSIVLAGWLLIDLVLKSLVNDQVYGVWNVIQCVDQPVSTTS